MTTTTKTWGQMNTYEQAASDLARALAEAKTGRDRDDIRSAHAAVVARRTPAAARAAVYLPAAAATAAAPVARVVSPVSRPSRPSRVCTYCGGRTSAALCCGDETVPA